MTTINHVHNYYGGAGLPQPAPANSKHDEVILFFHLLIDGFYLCR